MASLLLCAVPVLLALLWRTGYDAGVRAQKARSWDVGTAFVLDLGAISLDAAIDLDVAARDDDRWQERVRSDYRMVCAPQAIHRLSGIAS